MTAINWIAGDGDWNTAANWGTGTVPGPTDDAVISVSGYYSISVGQSISVNSITIGAGGASLSLSGASVRATIAASITNAGQIGLQNGTALTVGDVNNSGNLSLQSGAALTAAGNFNNSGSLAVDNSPGSSGGSSFTVNGTLTNSNSVQVGNSILPAPATLTVQGLNNTGGIGIQGGSSAAQQAVLNVTQGQAPTTWTGSVGLGGYALLEYAGTGQISAIASHGSIGFWGAQAFIASAGLGASSNSALALSSNAGGLSLQGGAALAAAGDFNNSGNLGVDNSPASSGGSSFTVNGTLTNSNNVEVGSSNLTVPATLTVQGLSNIGSIAIQGGGSRAQQAVLNVTQGQAPTTWTGSLSLSGNALLDYAGTSQISAIASNGAIGLWGAQAFIASAGLGASSNSALALSSNAGGLSLQGGAALTAAGDFNNSGSLGVDNSPASSGGSSFTVNGTLTNSNIVEVGSSNLTVPATLTVQGLSNTGGIEIQGGSSGVSFAVLKTFANAGTININARSLLTLNGPASNQGTINLGGATISSDDSSGLTICPEEHSPETELYLSL